MKIEIDQSGKIEETQRDTVLALSNGKSFSVKIAGRTKRRLQDIFRHIGEPRTFVITIFVVGVYELVKNNLKSVDQIILDIEYPGFEKIIIQILERILIEKGFTTTPAIHFGLIGKKSKAHKTAVAVFRREKKANKVLSFDSLAKECFTYKNGYPVLKYPVSKDR